MYIVNVCGATVVYANGKPNLKRGPPWSGN